MPRIRAGVPQAAVRRTEAQDLVVVDIKSVAALAPVHQAQVLTYLRLTRCPVGLLINFNVPRLMDGVKRLINAGGNRGNGGNGTTQRRRETE